MKHSQSSEEKEDILNRMDEAKAIVQRDAESGEDLARYKLVQPFDGDGFEIFQFHDNGNPVVQIPDDDDEDDHDHYHHNEDFDGREEGERKIGLEMEKDTTEDKKPAEDEDEHSHNQLILIIIRGGGGGGRRGEWLCRTKHSAPSRKMSRP